MADPVVIADDTPQEEEEVAEDVEMEGDVDLAEGAAEDGAEDAGDLPDVIDELPKRVTFLE